MMKAALNLHIGTEGFEPLQVLINGAGSAKITAPGESNICQTKAAQQRADQIIRGPAAAGRVIRNTGVVHMEQSISTVLRLMLRTLAPKS